MKKFLTFLATIFISLNAFAAEYLYIQVKDKDFLALETVLKETYGADYNYRSDYKLFTIKTTPEGKSTIFNKLQDANISLDSTDSPDAFVATSLKETKISDVLIVNHPSTKEEEFRCLLSYDSELGEIAKQYARTYGYSIQELDYQLRFAIKESQLKQFIEDLGMSEDFVFSKLGANRFSIKMLPLKEFKVNIYLSSSKDVNNLIADINADLRNDGSYELLSALEHRSAGTLSAELIVASRDLTKERIEEKLMFIAKKTKPNLRTRDLKIKELK